MKRVGWSRGLLGLVVAVSLALANAPAAAAAPTCTDSWVGGGGNWFVASNWSTGSVPGPNDAVCITAPGDYTIDVPGGPAGPTAGQALADTLQLGATSGTQKLAIEADNSCGDTTGAGGLEVFNHGGASTAASIGANGQVELTQSANTCSGVTNPSSLKVDAGALVNAGAITSDADGVAASAVTRRAIQGSVSNAGGTVTIDVDTTWSGATFDNAGAVGFSAVATMTVPAGTGATVVNDDGGTFGGGYPGGYLFVDSGNTFRMAARTGPSLAYSRPGGTPTVVIHSATLAYTGAAPSNIQIDGQSTLVGQVPSGSLLAIDCSGTEPAVIHTTSFTNAGFIGLYGGRPEPCKSTRTLDVDSAAGPGTGTLTNTGEIEGFGAIAGNVINSGRINPGDSFAPCSPCFGAWTPGQITVGGNYAQGPAGILGIINFITGTTTTLPNSQLSVGGTASIGGTLDMLNGTGGQLSTGNAFRILTAASVTGKFAELTGQPDPVFAVAYVPVYHATDVTVEVVKLPKLSVKLAGIGSGTVYSWQTLFSCTSGSCTMGFSPGRTVTLNATPSPHTTFNTWRSTFVGWSGACHGTGPCKLTMNGDRSVTATFTRVVRPRCTLALKSRRPKPTLTAVAACKQAAHLKLTGTVTEWLGSGRRARTRRFQVRPVLRKAGGSRTTTLVIRLPRAVLTALQQGRRAAIRLTLQATGPGGTAHASTRRITLRS